MSLQGSLSTMPLPDLLQWIAAVRKTGTLELLRGKGSKRILFREGRVAACASDEPADRLGHFLVSRGRITVAAAVMARLLFGFSCVPRAGEKPTNRSGSGSLCDGMHAYELRVNQRVCRRPAS